MLVEKITKDFKIPRLQVSGVFWNFFKIGIDAPLADFMADHRHGPSGDVIAVVAFRLRGLAIDPALESGSPFLDARIGRHMELVLRDLWPTGAAGPEAARIQRFV